MAVRVIDADVLAILDTDIDDLSPFITAANVLVEKLLASSGLAEAQLTEIERWLSAHFACMYDNRENEVWTDKSRAVFEGKTDMGLDYTRYGQMAKLLDTTGTLAASNASTAEGRRQGAIRVAPREE